jgi:formate/nitrite transporter FocA (FNT family)
MPSDESASESVSNIRSCAMSYSSSPLHVVHLEGIILNWVVCLAL